METGCKRWSNCFTCPFSDCFWGDEQELNAEKNKEKIRAYKKKWYETHKEEIKAKKKAKKELQESEVPV